MERELSTGERAAAFGRQIRSLRLRQDVDQRTLAARAGVALNVVKRLEAGKGATLTSLIKVLRALGRAEWLDSLAPAVSIRPMQLLKAKPTRQRASRRE
jgi:transcriptional regulator with XRE-family HTH domain